MFALTFHFPLEIDNDSSIVFKVDVYSLSSPPRLALSNYNGRVHLFPQIWLSLLYGCHYHIARASSWNAIESSASNRDGNDVQVLCSRVVGTVHDCGDWQTQCHSELCTRNLCSGCVTERQSNSQNRGHLRVWESLVRA